MSDKSCTTCVNYSDVCRKCVGSGIFSEYREKADTPTILDSGERREFDTGAVRDIQEGKGRCDLLPLDMVGTLIGDERLNSNEVILEISGYQRTHDCRFLQYAIESFCNLRGWDIFTALLEVSKHFEAGCKKYGERNWEKGIPEHCYIDSCIRHYLKWLAGWTDEPHDRAVIWNLICLWWTHKNVNVAEVQEVQE